MFKLEDWTANTTADNLTHKLFSAKKLKRKPDAPALPQTDSENKPSKLRKKEFSKKVSAKKKVDDEGEKKGHRVSTSTATTVKKQHKKPSIGEIGFKKSKKGKILTKSPRNKYKHLAVKNKDDNSAQSNSSSIVTVKETNGVDNGPSLSSTKHRTSVNKSMKLKTPKIIRKKSDSLTEVTSSKKLSKGKKLDGSPKEKKRRKKRKKKNNPKKNKYRHLVLAKSELSCDTCSKDEDNKEVTSPTVNTHTELDEQQSMLQQGLGKSKKRKMKETQVKGGCETENKPETKVDTGDVSVKKRKGSKTTEILKNRESNVSKLEQVLGKNKKRKIKETQDGGECETMVDTGDVKKRKLSKTTETLKDKMMAKLKSARFRYLNEQLYTQTGQTSYHLFQEDVEAFRVYHEGFQSQVNKWPSHPLEVIIKYINNRSPSTTVADCGCGDAKLAQSVANKVYSFDLVALNDHVTPCDMSKVPLVDESVDICVFCLSLMGTNLVDYLREANRVLKTGGILKIAEVASRITSLPVFVEGLKKLGFIKVNQNTSNKMFVLLDFKKISQPKKTSPELSLLPCVYKRR